MVATATRVIPAATANTFRDMPKLSTNAYTAETNELVDTANIANSADTAIGFWQRERLKRVLTYPK